METKKRSIAKAVTWRIMAIFTLGITSYIVTGNLKDVGILTLFYTVIQSIMYFVHERMWQKIKWAKIEHPLAKIKIPEKFSQDDIRKIEDKLREMGYL
ncbi:MAG: DUF2061 domain-containing protein [Elusimicrobiota bacterium]